MSYTDVMFFVCETDSHISHFLYIICSDDILSYVNINTGVMFFECMLLIQVLCCLHVSIVCTYVNLLCIFSHMSCLCVYFFTNMLFVCISYIYIMLFM